VEPVAVSGHRSGADAPTPATPDLDEDVEAMLTAADGFDDDTWDTLGRLYEASRSVDRYWMRRGPRDHAEEALRAAAVETHREAAVSALRDELYGSAARHVWGAEAALDAVWATLLADTVDGGPLTRADYDCLLDPWRAVTAGCPRSRLFLTLAATSVAHPADLWAVVDAILAVPAPEERHTALVEAARSAQPPSALSLEGGSAGG
jgi:hypothetical protein